MNCVACGLPFVSFRSLGAHSRYCTAGIGTQQAQESQDEVSNDNEVSQDEESVASEAENKDARDEEQAGGALPDSVGSDNEIPVAKRRKYGCVNEDKAPLYPSLDSESWNEIWLANFCMRNELSQEAAQEIVDWVKQVRRILYVVSVT